MCSLPFLSSVSLPLPGAAHIRAFQAVPSSHVRHSSSSESQAQRRLVHTSLLGPLPSPSLCLNFFFAQLALPSFLICEILSRESMRFCRIVSMLYFILVPLGKFPGSISNTQYRTICLFLDVSLPIAPSWCPHNNPYKRLFQRQIFLVPLPCLLP